MSPTFCIRDSKDSTQICMKICYCLACLAYASVPTLLFISRRVAAIARGIPITIGPMIRNSGGSPGIILAIIIGVMHSGNFGGHIEIGSKHAGR
jgi:hypothetical protein